VKNGQIVTFGITPTHAEIAYGYLELATPFINGIPCALARFVEKPSANIAEDMLAAGNCLWNSGIFLVAAKDLIAASAIHAEALLPPVKCAVEKAVTDLGFLRLAPDEWAQVEDISIDYAVMEHATNLSVVPFGEAWSDLGGWDAVWREHNPDANGVVSGPSTTAIECQNTLLRSETAGLELVGLGLKNVLAIAMNDAVLVADMSYAQDVKKVVDTLKDKKVSQAISSAKDHRPWGWFESLAISGRFQVKRIHVLPNAALSLQSHHHRSEHWIVVQGTARVTLDDEVKLVAENESVYIPLGAKHRLENPGKVSMVLIEVQTGTYLGEDDIIRYDDNYNRNLNPNSK
jgi:mannose-1-phosphate guanylyltransferase/mannose-6-phosphate isomerase